MYWRDRNIEVGGQTGGGEVGQLTISSYIHTQPYSLAIFRKMICVISRHFINIFTQAILRGN